MKQHHHLVDFILAQGHAIRVDDGEEITGALRDRAEIIEAIEAVEEATVHAVVLAGDKRKRIGWFFVIPDLADDETVADYSATRLSSEWEIDYANRYGEEA
ncbi:MAG: hypothetical protein WC997_02335 [Porticoccaceae bacterium]